MKQKAVKKMKASYFKYIGLTKEIKESPTSEEYKPAANDKTAGLYLDYLKEREQFQYNRQNTIESKNSQIVGQASIVISIIALFIPLWIDKFSYQSILILFPMIFGFLFVLFHYVLTIYHSTKTLEVNRYNYQTRSTSTLTHKDRATDDLTFLNEEIGDLISIINKNEIQNNIKGSNLIYAVRCFKIASIGFASFAIILIGISFFLKTSPQEIMIKDISNKTLNQIQTQIIDRSPSTIYFDSEIIRLNSSIENINLQIDSLNNVLSDHRLNFPKAMANSQK